MAQRTNPVAEIIGIPNIRLYTAIDACGRRRSEIANFNTLDCYIYPGSTEEYWGRQDAAQAIALVSPITPSLFIMIYFLTCKGRQECFLVGMSRSYSM